MKFFMLLLFVSLSVGSQKDSRVYFKDSSYPAFINDTANLIRGNTRRLDKFFEELYMLRTSPNEKGRRVTILHIGDSHLQAGFLNGAVMRSFHRDFGNAGRGLIVPLKLTNTNEPYDYTIESDITWSASRCLSKRPKFPVGIGGISIATTRPAYHLDVSVSGKDEQDYRFNKIQVYHYPTTTSLHPVIKDGVSVREEESGYPFITTFASDQLLNEISFEGNGTGRDSSIYYGFSLENGKPGVLYHSIGINGAQFIHYGNIDNFLSQVNAIAPDVIIFSLGTNEAFRDNINKAYMVQEMDRVVLPIIKNNPRAAIIMTTPPECQYKRPVKGVNTFIPNPYIKPISEAIIEYASQHSLAYWDLFGISGGENSSGDWVKANYLARDRIHFAISGYRLQANLLYHAILKSYNQYVDTRFRKIDFIIPIPFRGANRI